MDKKHNGAHNELIASCWLLRQGYEVFRNLSPHGYVDIIAMKNGQITLFDVKKASLLASGEPVELKLSQEQIDLGVKILCVYGDDNKCRINENPRLSNWRRGNCRRCGKEFVAKKTKQTFCSPECRMDLKNRKLYVKRHGAEERPSESYRTNTGIREVAGFECDLGFAMEKR